MKTVVSGWINLIVRMMTLKSKLSEILRSEDKATISGPAGSNRGNLGSMPAPVARGCHGPRNILLLFL